MSSISEKLHHPANDIRWSSCCYASRAKKQKAVSDFIVRILYARYAPRRDRRAKAAGSKRRAVKRYDCRQSATAPENRNADARYDKRLTSPSIKSVHSYASYFLTASL
ncbi:hypothetical protein KCP73_10640 [Salmonella enterica subsp. enterica]|nr:hypothetical protein KCP73_10640 [Salmonella enterica subsp. enterica]